MKIVVSEFMDESALSAFGPEAEVLYDPTLVDNREALLGALAGASGLIVRNRTQVDQALLDAAPDLRVVGRLGVGLDNIDMAACAERGVAVKPATGANTLSVAEYVISTALTLLRGAYTSKAGMIAGDWPRNALIGAEASGRTMGLLGFGGIARAVAERARALGMEIAAFDPYLPDGDAAWQGVARCTINELLERSDVLSLHVPLTDETRGLIGADALARMKPGAIVINTARGGVVDEPALAKALRQGRLGGAALDVFDVEPLSAEAGQVFDGIDDIVLTPHIAGVTEEGNIRVSAITVENVCKELTQSGSDAAPDTAPEPSILPRAEAEAMVARAFTVAGASDANALSTARALVAAEVDGQKGHGFSRVASYTAQLRSGKVRGDARPVLQTRGARVDIDAQDGFAFPAIECAIEELARLAPETGIAMAAIRRSHHCGQLGAHVERLADAGLVALMVANTPKAMAPWGGHAPLFGTNPIAFAAPRDGAPPMVIDLSLSKVARGKVMAASKSGDPIPEGWALDADGNPTTDPVAALKGTMLPTGDAKGAALALIVEVLAATLTGANRSDEASSFFDAEGPAPGVGQMILAFDTSAVPDFGGRIEALVAAITGQPGTRLPGERRLEGRRASQDGQQVTMPAHLRAEIEALAGA